MVDVAYLLAGFFLPLFPMSMLFGRLFTVSNRLARLILLLVWPQLGVLVTGMVTGAPPPWFFYWAVLTSALYALRALALRDVGLWTGFIAISSWSLLWLLRMQGVEEPRLHYHALGFSVPLVLLGMLAAALERRFGAAYTGLFGGLARTMPRFSTLLVLVVLAAVATPLFPSFAAMLEVLSVAFPAAPLAGVIVGAVWLLWTWAGSRLLQGLIVGHVNEDYRSDDLALPLAMGIGVTLALLVAAGVYLIGGLA